MYNNHFITYILNTINKKKHDFVGRVYGLDESSYMKVAIKETKLVSKEPQTVLVHMEVVLNKKHSKINLTCEGYLGDFFPKCKYGKTVNPITRKGKAYYKKYGGFQKIKKIKSLSMRIHSSDGSVNIIEIKRKK